MKSRKKIAEAFRQYNLLVTLFSFAIVGIVYLTSEYFEFHQNNKTYREEKLREQKSIIHKEVEKAVTLVLYRQSSFSASLRDNMRKAVAAAKISIGNKCIPNHGKSHSLCSNTITACPMKVFCIDKAGLNKILGTKLLNIDSSPTTLKEVELRLRTKGEVYVFHSNDSAKANITLTYLVARNQPEKFLGISANWTQQESTWKKETLEELALERFGKNNEGYIFINTYDGDPLITNGIVTIGEQNIWNLQDPRGNKVVQLEYKAAQKADGDYIYYSWRKVSPPGQKAYIIDSLIYPKVSYVKGIPQLKWMVGAGVYLDDIEVALAQNENRLLKTFQHSLIFFLILLLLSLFFSYILAHRFSQQLEASTQQLIKFLQLLSRKPSASESSPFQFSEFQDIATIARELEDNRVQVETTFRQLVELYPDAITIMEEEVFTYINDAWLKHLGYTLDDIPTLSDWFLQAYRQEDYRQEIRERWITFFATDPLDGKSMEEMWVTCKNGENKYFVARTIRLLKNRLMVVLTDITEIRNYEMELVMAKKHAEASDKLKSAFLANMSHEIRTPMNAIVGFSSLLQKTSITEERKEKYIRLIQSSSNSLLTLINDIIDISKLESGQLNISPEVVDIASLLTEVYYIQKVLFEENEHGKVRLILSIPSPLTLKVDPQRLRQVLVNLIHNAYKFTDKGKVEFGFSPVDPNANEVTFYCSDSGRGISVEYSDKVFERFMSFEPSTEKVSSGTGLGLAISKNLVELMGGRIWFNSEEKEGTTFFFTLPTAM